MTAGSTDRTSVARSGLILFAAAMMIVNGLWLALAGLAALFNDEVYVTTPEYIYAFDLTAWGWIHLLLGIAIAVAGFAVNTGATWARITGIGLACLSLVANFLFIPYYPIWSLTIIALGIAVIWALATAGRETA
jgi:hypothetical protein